MRTDTEAIQSGDLVVVHMGSVIPFDGLIVDGEAMVNQASLTGEGLPVRKESGGIFGWKKRQEYAT